MFGLLDLGFPFVKYRYFVGIMIGNIPNPVDMAFSSVDGLAYRRNLVRKANLTTFADAPNAELRTLTLTRGVFGGASPLTIAQLLQMPFFHEKLLRYDIVVSVITADGDPGPSWLVADAYLESWTWDKLNADENAVLTETMVLKYSSLLHMPGLVLNKRKKAGKPPEFIPVPKQPKIEVEFKTGKVTVLPEEEEED